MNGFLVVAVCSQNDVPLSIYDEHGLHAAIVAAGACGQSPERASAEYRRAFQAVGCLSVMPPYAFRVLQIVGGEVVGCVYDTDTEPSPMAEDLADFD